jgi:hypothetical protein
MARLPSSGPISGSQIGVYAFSRSATAEFSISSSFQQGIYGTIFLNSSGLQWAGYNKVGTVSNLALSDWYDYAKSKTVVLGNPQSNDTDACNDVGGVTTVYVDNNADLEASDWVISDVVGAGTFVYSNPQGTDQFNGQDQYYGYAIIGANYSVRINGEGIPSECTRCP